ncbi:MAG TPA: response regulator [Rhizomicrobium sp.]|nr:response regulator [Rhizomicrobium sp.]
MSASIHSPGTVLVTEDEPMVRAVVAETLLDAGYTVQEAGDGMEAMETLEAGSIDLLITDIQMPRMNGYQLAEAAMARWPKLKIMLMTGYAREGVPVAIASAGLPTLKKPFDLDRLPGLVSELLARK